WQFDARDNAVAHELFERAAALDPGFSPFFAGIALSRLFDHTLRYRPASERNLEAALEAARHAVAIDEKDASAHSILGRAYTVLGNHEAGIAELRRALQLNPNLALAHYGLGMALVLSGSPKEAIEQFDAAERLSPHDPFLWTFAMWRAWSRISLEDFARAVEDASNATRQPNADRGAIFAARRIGPETSASVRHPTGMQSGASASMRTQAGAEDVEARRLEEDVQREKNWKRWGPYLSERQWGTVREDYSE